MPSLLKEIRYTPLLWLLVPRADRAGARKGDPEAHTVLFVLAVLGLFRFVPASDMTTRRANCRDALEMMRGLARRPLVMSLRSCGRDDQRLVLSYQLSERPQETLPY
jgi:hypothetical protein